MTRTSLSDLYRRLSGTSAPAPEAADADDLVAAADGSLAADRRDAVAGVLAASARHADLFRVLRDLKPDSEALAAGIATHERGTAHRRRQASPRRAATHRRSHASRWAALAACLVAVVGAWSVHHLRSGDLQPGARATLARADVIFSTRDTPLGNGDSIFSQNMEPKSAHAKPHSGGDRVFHGDFSGG